MSVPHNNQKPIRAVFCDMDGTLLSPQHRVSPYTIDVLQRLRAAGVKFVIATGRPYADVRATLRETGLRPDYVITSNGARVHDGGDGGGADRKLLISHDVDPAVVRELLQLAAQPREDGTVDEGCGPKRFYTNIYRGEEWIADNTVDEVRVAFHESFTCRCVGAEGLRALPEAELRGVHYGWFLAERPEDLQPLAARLRTAYADTLTCSFSLPFILDFVASGVDKGVAVTEVAALLGLGLDEVAAFGDGENDAAMLRVAGRAFVMSNASPSVKAAAPPHAEVIGSNADDGVAKKLEEIFLTK